MNEGLFFFLPLAFVGNPAMLGWLAAAAAPLIIHLLNRRKYREAPWAAMQYLLAAIRKNSRRVRLEHWLMLALRTLLIVLVVVAAAEPGFRGAGMLLTAGDRVHRIFVVDGSFSMDYRPTGGESYFDQVKKLMRRSVENGREGDGYSLVLLGTPARTVVGPPLFRQDDVLTIVDDLTQPHGAGDMTHCLNELDRIIDASRKQYPQIKQRIVTFLTDLGRRTWAPNASAGGADPIAEFQSRCERWGAGTNVVVVDVGLADAENTAVVELIADEPYAVVGVPTTVRAVVRHFGRTRRAGVTAVLKLDGRKIDEKTFDVEPNADAIVVFDAAAADPPREPGERVYEIELTHDQLELDDRRRLVLEVKPQLRVLVVADSAPSEDEEYGLETLELALRLKPGVEGLGASPVAVETETDEVLQRRDLGEFDCVFLVDVRRFSPAAVRILHNYVRGGGGLVWILGPRIDVRHYNESLAAGDFRVLPAKLGPEVAEAQYKLNPLKYEHPLLTEFRAGDKGNLLNTPIYRYYRLDTADRPQTRRALEFLNTAKDPFIVSETIDLGRSILVATGLESTWSALPHIPGFTPVVQEMLTFASGGRIAGRVLTVGDSLTGTFLRTTAAGQVSVTPPTATSTSGRGRATIDGPSAPIAAEVSPQGEFYRWTFDDTSLSGLYLVDAGAAPRRRMRFAVNLDPAESDPTKLAPGRLTEKPWTGVRFDHTTTLQDFSEPTASYVAAGEQSPIHRWLLMTALAAAFCESWYAGRIGRRRL